MHSFRHQRQSGFTLIELVIVIVIIGILAAVAIPKYIDLAAAAKTSAVEGVAGNFASAYATDVAMCSAYPGNDSRCVVAAPACNNTTLTTLLPGVNGYGVAVSGSGCLVSLTADANYNVNVILAQ